MKAPKIDPQPDSLTIAPHRKAKNVPPTSLCESAASGAQTRLLPCRNKQSRQARIQALQARIDANAYHVDGISIAQHMLTSPMTRWLLDIDEQEVTRENP